MVNEKSQSGGDAEEEHAENEKTEENWQSGDNEKLYNLQSAFVDPDFPEYSSLL